MGRAQNCMNSCWSQISLKTEPLSAFRSLIGLSRHLHLMEQPLLTLSILVGILPAELRIGELRERELFRRRGLVRKRHLPFDCPARPHGQWGSQEHDCANSDRRHRTYYLHDTILLT